MIGTESIIALIICGLFTTLIPIAAVVVFKLKNKSVSLLSAVIGAATFIVFALVLEQIMHIFMLPIVSNSTVAYVIYGVLAAGVFEETGRFLACKFLMKKRSDNKNAIMLGIGHGGIESVLIIGISMFSSAKSPPFTYGNAASSGSRYGSRSAGLVSRTLKRSMRAFLKCTASKALR